MNPAAIDLNLLFVFEALLLERGVGRAGQRIGLSQPAVSNALARLRSALGDALFVRSGKAMVPTARALQLSVPILEALNGIRAAVGGDGAFDPSTANVRFRIEAFDYAEAFVIAPLMHRLRGAAPGIALQVRRSDALFDVPADALTADAVDYAIGFFPDVVPGSGLAGMVLMYDRLVAVSAKRRPALATLKDFAASPQIRVNLGRDRAGLIDDALARRGLRRNVVVTMPDLGGIPPLVSTTDLIAVLPERLAKLAAPQWRLRIHRLPLQVPRLRLSAVWHQRNHDSPSHAWLRRELTNIQRLNQRHHKNPLDK